jgi:formate hydrogenlyase subunit 3/multisubunit Na+/H+ antiporter MnhD subunit
MDNMLRVYRKKLIWGLIALLIVFGIVFVITFINLKGKRAVFNLGLPFEIEDFTVMFLCILSLVKVVWEIIKIEKLENLENRIKTKNI